MHSVTTAAAGALALALVLYLGLARYPLQIEQHLLDSAQASLNAAELDWAAVRMSGRDLHLLGAPPDADSYRYALRLLNFTKGVRVVIDDTERAAMTPAKHATAAAAPAPTPRAARAATPRGDARSVAQAARLCQTTFEALLSGQTVKFVPGKALVSLESAELLQQVAQTAERCASARLEVAAHTDASGDPTENFRTSQARAEAVVDYLVTQGVHPARLQARGYGAQAPIASNRTAAGRERNRRIEITVLRDSE